jgi:hypothetical protein
MAKSVREVLNRAFEGLPTYRATFADLNAPSGLVVTLKGAIGMVIRVKTVHVDVPAANQTPLMIRKYSTAESGGTPGTAGQRVPLDSNSAAARATLAVYTAAATAGTLIGEVFEDDIFTVDNDAYRGDRVHEEFGKGDGCESLILRTAAETMGIVLGAGSNPLNGYIEWTEEPAVADPTPNI